MRNKGRAERRHPAAGMIGGPGSASWLMVISGLVLVIWGVMAIAAPGIGLLALGTYFGIAALVSGALALYVAVRERRDVSTFGIMLLEAVLLMGVGIVLLVNPVATALSIPVAVALWAIFAGLVQGVQAFNTRENGVTNWWLHAVTGLLSIVFGALVISRLPVGAVAVSWLMGVAAIAVGVFRMFFGLQMAEIRRLIRQVAVAPAAEVAEPPEERRAA